MVDLVLNKGGSIKDICLMLHVPIQYLDLPLAVTAPVFFKEPFHLLRNTRLYLQSTMVSTKHISIIEPPLFNTRKFLERNVIFFFCYFVVSKVHRQSMNSPMFTHMEHGSEPE